MTQPPRGALRSGRGKEASQSDGGQSSSNVNINREPARGTGTAGATAAAAEQANGIISESHDTLVVMTKDVSGSSMVANSPASPSSPMVHATIRIRRATEAVETASKQSAAEIDASLEVMETRLAQVKSQEEEVRAIVKAHVDREAELKKMLEDLYLQYHRVKDDAVQVVSSPLRVEGGPTIPMVARDGGDVGDGMPPPAQSFILKGAPDTGISRLTQPTPQPSKISEEVEKSKPRSPQQFSTLLREPSTTTKAKPTSPRQPLPSSGELSSTSNYKHAPERQQEIEGSHPNASTGQLSSPLAIMSRTSKLASPRHPEPSVQETSTTNKSKPQPPRQLPPSTHKTPQRDKSSTASTTHKPSSTQEPSNSKKATPVSTQQRPSPRESSEKNKSKPMSAGETLPFGQKPIRSRVSTKPAAPKQPLPSLGVPSDTSSTERAPPPQQSASQKSSTSTETTSASAQQRSPAAQKTPKANKSQPATPQQPPPSKQESSKKKKKGKPTSPRQVVTPASKPKKAKKDSQPESPRRKDIEGLSVAAFKATKSGVGHGMRLAVAMGSLEDDLLTRDAATIKQHILLMSWEGLEEERAAEGLHREQRPRKRWRQSGLTLTEALDRADAHSTRPSRLPSLFPLAAVMQAASSMYPMPMRSPPATARKRNRTDIAPTTVETSTQSFAEKLKGSSTASGSGNTEADVHAFAVPAPQRANRRRIDANAIMCPFELNGVCNDDGCRYQHMDDYLPGVAPRTHVAPAGSGSDSVSTGSGGATSTPPGEDSAAKANRTERRTAQGTSAASAPSLSTSPKAPYRHKLHFLPPVQLGPIVEVGTPQSRTGGGGGGEEGGEGRAAKRPRMSEHDAGGKGINGRSEKAPADQSATDGAKAATASKIDEELSDGKGLGHNGADETDGDGFLALSTGVDETVAASTVGDGGTANRAIGEESNATTDVTPDSDAAGHVDPAALAKLFAQVASADGIFSEAGSKGKGSGKGSARREERYYSGDAQDDGTQPPVSIALTETQLSSLEARLSEETSCNVEGWLLLAMHRLPRTGNSATAVLSTVRVLTTRGRGGPVESSDVAAIKLALRALVKGLEKCEQGEAEELWALYLTLYSLIPGFLKDALSMAEDALDNFHTSRRMWRLYCCMSEGKAPGSRASLPEKISLHWQRIQVLLEPVTDVEALEGLSLPAEGGPETVGAGAGEKTPLQHSTPVAPPATAAVEETKTGDIAGKKNTPHTTANATESVPGNRGNNSQSTAPGAVQAEAAGEETAQAQSGQAGTEGISAAPLGDDVVGMIAYLVLERCSIVANAGYTLQAAIEVLEALGETEQILWWRIERGEERSLLRVPEEVRGVQSAGEETVGSEVTAGAGNSKDNGRAAQLPQGVDEALEHAPRPVRCLLWLAALHLLVLGFFPPHALLVAEHFDVGKDDDGSHDDENPSRTTTRGCCPTLLRWPEEWLSQESKAGARLAASSELLGWANQTFMSALQDMELLPSSNGRGGRWAPPLQVQDALLPSAVEANAARLGCMAPQPSVLEGAQLALALNWLTFCCRCGRTDGKNNTAEDQTDFRTVALACCRRFQLSRPDHAALLEHTLLEHDVVSTKRSLADVYREIAYAFGENGAAEAARRERGELQQEGADRRNEIANTDVLHPSGSRLEATYAFLRFAEARERDRDVLHGIDQPKIAPAWSAAAAAASTGFSREADGSRNTLRNALVGLWVEPSVKHGSFGRNYPKTPAGTSSSADEPLRQAIEGAKGSLFHWADDSDYVPGGDSLSMDRQLSTILFALWVLGGPAIATEALDHLLSADSFSRMSAERRRLSWLHRLEAAIVLSDQQVSVSDGSFQGMREVTLRALSDKRARPRLSHPTLAHYVAYRLEKHTGADNATVEALVLGIPSASSFVHEVLTIYSKWFRAKGGGVDWEVVAEALGSGNETSRSVGRDGGGGKGEAAPSTGGVLALLRWVDLADDVDGADRDERSAAESDVAADAAMALRSNARPYAQRALSGYGGTGDPDLVCVVAALEASTDEPDRAQLILEAALRERPLCAALWELRLALESGFGGRLGGRAHATAKAAALSSVLVRLSSGLGSSAWREGRSSSSRSRALSETRVSRLMCALSHPMFRRELRSLEIKSAAVSVDGTVSSRNKRGVADIMGDAGGNGTSSSAGQPAHRLPFELPRGIFLLTGLVGLTLCDNELRILPAALGRLQSLRSLDASRNALTSLPPSLSRLAGSLRSLRLAQNRLSLLAVWPVAKLTGLNTLDLEQNKLLEFPAEVLGLSKLRTLKLAGNGFPRHPHGSLRAKLPELKDYTLPENSVPREKGNEA